MGPHSIEVTYAHICKGFLKSFRKVKYDPTNFAVPS